MSTKYYTKSGPVFCTPGPVLTISPENLHYGVVSNGFVYSLKFTGRNNIILTHEFIIILLHQQISAE